MKKQLLLTLILLGASLNLSAQLKVTTAKDINVETIEPAGADSTTILDEETKKILLYLDREFANSLELVHIDDNSIDLVKKDGTTLAAFYR